MDAPDDLIAYKLKSALDGKKIAQAISVLYISNSPNPAHYEAVCEFCIKEEMSQELIQTLRMQKQSKAAFDPRIIKEIAAYVAGHFKKDLAAPECYFTPEVIKIILEIFAYLGLPAEFMLFVKDIFPLIGYDSAYEPENHVILTVFSAAKALSMDKAAEEIAAQFALL